MNLSSMKQQLATVKPVKATKAQSTVTVQQPEETLGFRTLVAIGAAPSNVLYMVDVIKTSHKYHEALRKGELS